MLGVAICCGMRPAFRSRWPHRANNSPHPPETQTKTGVAYKERVTPLKMAFGCRNMSGNLISTIKIAYSALGHQLVFFQRIFLTF
jgi:hypothetical protein